MVPDPRCERKKKHDHAEILLCLILGYLAGRTTIRRALLWAGNNLEFLREYLPYRNGIASPPTACRLLWELDIECFAMAFMQWIGEIAATNGTHLAIDGKALRGALGKVNVEASGRPMLMNVLDVVTGLVVGQLPMNDKESEIRAIPEMLRVLDIEGSTITADAIGTQTAIMNQTVEQGGHFVFIVKKNHPGSYSDIMEAFGALEEERKAMTEAETKGKSYNPVHGDMLAVYDEAESFEKNRDRNEYRSCCVCPCPKIVLRTEEEWIHVRTVGKLCQVRIPIEKDRYGNDITPDKETFLKSGSRRVPLPKTGDGMEAHIQDVGLISDLELSAEEIMGIKRAHWLVENSLHHVLDDAFREDRSPAKRSRNSLSLIRKFAYNILRIAMIAGKCSRIFTEAMDAFCDNKSLMREYVFSGIKSLY